MHWLGRFAIPSVFSVVARIWSSVLCNGFSGAENRGRCRCAQAPARERRRDSYRGDAVLMLALLPSTFPLGLTDFRRRARAVRFRLPLETTVSGPSPPEISWAVLPLVVTFRAGEGLQTGVINHLANAGSTAAKSIPAHAGWISGAVVAVACNLINNLPAALSRARRLPAHAPRQLPARFWLVWTLAQLFHHWLFGDHPLAHSAAFATALKCPHGLS